MRHGSSRPLQSRSRSPTQHKILGSCYGLVFGSIARQYKKHDVQRTHALSIPRQKTSSANIISHQTKHGEPMLILVRWLGTYNTCLMA